MAETYKFVMSVYDPDEDVTNHVGFEGTLDALVKDFAEELGESAKNIDSFETLLKVLNENAGDEGTEYTAGDVDDIADE